jgi:hypothetical protein
VNITVEMCVFALDGVVGDGGAGGEAGGWKLHWRKCISAAVVVVGSDEDVDGWFSETAGVSISRGNGRMNWGCCRAVCARRVYVSRGMVAHIDIGLDAWRRRQSVSTSFAGSVCILGTSR